jgi:rhamnose utilization protein RhaD (predicted bifunctional aldolase and dehydrogenase)/NAD(P)-dependent dehydrogenase (short-subunit alcohol dehydrogenase family)
MKNLWSDTELTVDADLLDGCVYASHLLGSDPSLVLHGGGNTSFKAVTHDLAGEPLEVLWVKGSGWNLATIGRAGFTAVDRRRVARLADLEHVSDTDMELELRRSQLDPAAPCPSVEAMIHAAVPDAAVQHTHADAVLAISNTSNGQERMHELFGELAVVVPYARSGFAIGRSAIRELESHRTDRTIGLILMNHGVFTFGADHHQAYDRMIQLVTMAEDYLHRSSRGAPITAEARSAPSFDRNALAALRADISRVAERPCIVSRHVDDETWSFTSDPDVRKVAGRGPVTPDHVIWTKYEPLFGREVDAYADWYRAYFAANRDRTPGARMLDPAPRIIIDDALGLLSAGPDVRSADIAADIYRHTIRVIRAADAIGGYEALPESDIFDLEYWELEQAKLDLHRPGGEFTGEVAVVTGAASGIGRACAHELLDRGAAVIGLDISPSITDVTDAPSFLGVLCDLTSLDAASRALDSGVERFGGVDMLVASAGLFPESSPIGHHDPAAWRKAMSVNVDALIQMLYLLHPLLLAAPKGGRVTVIGSKNVQAPGPGASAYSASKAAAHQITRIAALEWAPEGIRVNSVHPDAVFDTALWTDDLLASRAEKYGMTIAEYKRRNLLGVEITSADVAKVVATTLSDSFRTVTGAHVPIDGGNDRVI